MTINELINEKLSSLSHGQRKVAQYILQDLNAFSYATLSKLSKEISVSETTIIRLAYSLGFDSFSEMQRKIRSEILAEPQANNEEVIQHGHFYQTTILKELSCISDWAAHLDQENMDRIVQALLAADKILVVGARSSYSAALWFGSLLDKLLGNTFVISEFHDSRFELLSTITEKTVVFCITFARYTRWTNHYAEITKKRGATIIAATDGITSPIIDNADTSIILESNKDDMGFNSFVCLYCLFNALIAKIQKERQGAISERLKTMEDVLSDFDIFYE